MTRCWNKWKKLWELEAIGVSTQEETVHEKFLDTIHLNNDRYGVSLPWKEQHALLLDKYVRVVFGVTSSPFCWTQ